MARGAILAASVAVLTVASPVAGDARVAHADGLADKKGSILREEPPLLATLVQVHTGDCVPLDAEEPSTATFESLLADRVTGEERDLDARLLGLLRNLAALHEGARIEIVSGYRSWKLNEILRKKGHHVASHSQHSLGHAVDFRIIPPGESEPIDPRTIENEVRAGGWDGGVGVYLTKDDRFVHADVGPTRRWSG